MKEEAAAFLGKAPRCLGFARRNLNVGLTNDAGRNAYLAAFHAAQAIIVERTGKVAKTHSGVHSEFARLTGSEPAVGPEIRKFLAQAYDLKALADYETGPDSDVPPQRASEAITRAEQFVACIASLLDDCGST
ncbi:HEPN domain-containing protein [Azospirillum halopraeferens]|uniref:HEPN domain-containing protein n=1 Tax=Azospirillum halopraeferens TaxID=34010 RepID=UPI0004902CF7|nr:HEPN domain-containing protein [Azospirillum halopraeferens]